MGRPVRGEWGVAARCHLGIPMVIESHPVLEDGSPFPTLYWLTCPILIKRVAKLESEGAMSELNDRLGDDVALRGRLVNAIDAYRVRRDMHAVIDDKGAPPGGGPQRVKCLHAHMAHHLATKENPVGALTLAATGWPDCIAPCVSE
ncbi:MAG: DUF501 domain-containing protein [Actinomycetota bacterium]